MYLATDFYNTNISKQYWTSLYYAIFLLVGSEVGPQTFGQYIFCSFGMLSGAIMTSFIFGEMVVVMGNIDRENREFNELRGQIYNTMITMKLPEELRLKILYFFIANHQIRNRHVEHENFLKLLPPSLQSRVNSVIFGHIIGKMDIYQTNTLIEYSVNKIKIKFTPPEYVIIKQYDKADKFCFITQGQCEVVVNDSKMNPRVVRVLETSEYFGEIGLIYKVNRTATVKTIGYCSYAILAGKDFDYMLSIFPEFKENLISMSADYKDPWKSYIKRLISRVKYFQNLDAQQFNLVMYNLKRNILSSGQLLIKQGERVNNMYFITKGGVNLHFISLNVKPSIAAQLFSLDASEAYYRKLKRIPNIRKDLYVEHLSKGSVLFPRSVLIQDTTFINVQAVSRTVVFSIPASILHEIMEMHPIVKQDMEKVRDKLVVYNSLTRRNDINSVPIDCIKSCDRTYEDWKQKKQLWKRFWKLKNEALRIIINRRKTIEGSQVSTHERIKRVRAAILAHSKGKNSFGRKIALGKLPHELVVSTTILTIKEVQNPLMAQMATSMLSLLEVHRKLRHDISNITNSSIRGERRLQEMMNSVIHAHELLDVVLELMRDVWFYQKLNKNRKQLQNQRFISVIKLLQSSLYTHRSPAIRFIFKRNSAGFSSCYTTSMINRICIFQHFTLPVFVIRHQIFSLFSAVVISCNISTGLLHVVRDRNPCFIVSGWRELVRDLGETFTVPQLRGELFLQERSRFLGASYGRDGGCGVTKRGLEFCLIFILELG